MNTPGTQLRRFVFIAMVMLSLVAAAPSSISAQGNSEAAHACQGDGYLSLVGINGETFSNVGQCVRFAAHGGIFADGTDVLEGTILVPAGYSVNYNSELAACNGLTFGYWASDGASGVLDSIPEDGCSTGIDYSSAAGTIGPFAEDVAFTVYLQDDSCGGVTYNSDDTSSGHVAVFENAPFYEVNIADAGSGCNRSGTISTFNLPGNLHVYLDVHP